MIAREMGEHEVRPYKQIMKRTPLYDIHKKLGGRMVEFGGWEMPVQYKGVMEEHHAVRERAGLFDISHMGEIFVEGPKAHDFINYLTTNDIYRIENGGCQYSACCYENGGVVDDVISYQFSPEKYLVVVNASNTEKDFEWFKKNNTLGVSIRNRSAEFCQLALQGPLSQKILEPLVETDLGLLKYYTFVETFFQGKEIIISRTGYTGEDGFELYGKWGEAPFFWNSLLEQGAGDGIMPVGLSARDTLRLESAYSLYGHEISETINPFEARLNWIVKLDKSDFIGKKILKKIKAGGPHRTLIGLEMVDAGVPRQGYKIWFGDQEAGEVTSGTFSPTLNKGIALALVKSENALENEFEIEIRGAKRRGRSIILPFYKRGG